MTLDCYFHLICILFVLCLTLFVAPGNPQCPDAGPASARVPQQSPAPAPTAACPPAARHDDAGSGHQHAPQHAQRGRRSHADAHGRYQPTAPAGEPTAVPLPSLQLRYRPALSSSPPRLLEPLLLPFVPQPSPG